MRRAFFKVGNSPGCILIPKAMLDALGWDADTIIDLDFSKDEESIVVSRSDNQKRIVRKPKKIKPKTSPTELGIWRPKLFTRKKADE